MDQLYCVQKNTACFFVFTELDGGRIQQNSSVLYSIRGHKAKKMALNTQITLAISETLLTFTLAYVFSKPLLKIAKSRLIVEFGDKYTSKSELFDKIRQDEIINATARNSLVSFMSLVSSLTIRLSSLPNFIICWNQITESDSCAFDYTTMPQRHS